MTDKLDGSTERPYGWLRRIEPTAYRRWRDAFARMPRAITVETAHGPVRIVHAESPHESWDRATELLERGKELDVALMGWAGVGLDARKYRRRPVAGVRALVHGHEPVSDPEHAANRLNIDTGAGVSYLDQLTLARIDTEPLEIRTFEVIDW